MSLVGVSYENINRLDEVTSLVGTELLVAAVNSRDRSVTVDTLANFVAIGSVTGPSSAVDSNLAAFDGITGDLIKDSGLALADIILRDGTVPYTGNQDFGGNDITNVVDITLEGVGAALRSGVNSNTRLEFSNAGIDLNSNNFTNFFIGGVQKGQLTDTLWLFQTDARFNEQVAIGGAVSGSEKLRVIGDAVVTGNFSQIAPITGFESKLGVHTLSGDVSFSSPTDGIFGSGAGYLAWNGENNRTSGYWAQNFNSGTGAAKGAFFGMVDDDVRIGSVADHKVQLQQNQSDRIVFLVNGEIEMFGQVKLNNILKFTSALGKIEGNNSAVNITLNEGNAGDLRLKSDVEIESTINCSEVGLLPDVK